MAPIGKAFGPISPSPTNSVLHHAQTPVHSWRMTNTLLCIGSVLWDIIGRTPQDMPLGSDKPGRIERRPGGVALNVANTLRAQSVQSELISVVGTDSPGDDLLDTCRQMGLGVDYVLQMAALPTDRYMAIESPAGLVGAIADAHSLEEAGDRILAPLRDGRLGSDDAPFDGTVVVDGNMLEQVLEQIATLPALARADLRVVPASPGKARRMLSLRPHPRAIFYVNREEAQLLLGQDFATASEAAQAMVRSGLARAIVTDGGQRCADACADHLVEAEPPQVQVRQITGAGDAFIAGHIAGERQGHDRAQALAHALDVAAHHVSGEFND